MRVPNRAGNGFGIQWFSRDGNAGIRVKIDPKGFSRLGTKVDCWSLSPVKSMICDETFRVLIQNQRSAEWERKSHLSRTHLLSLSEITD
jgi:hypothetical protein